jgi:hypothetical protein
VSGEWRSTCPEVSWRATRARGLGRRGRSCRWRRVAREADRGRSDPAVGGVGALCEGVAACFAVGAELSVNDDELRSGVDDLGSLNLGLEPEHAGVPPAAAKRAVAEFGGGLERDQRWATSDDRRVAVRERCSWHQIRAEDVCIDDDRPAWPSVAHDSTAATNAAPSSSSMSSMTISSCGGNGRARGRSSSTGSSRCRSSLLSARCVATMA